MTTLPEGKAVLRECPFCKASAHHGLGKIEHDQLHGDRFQRYHVWCPRGCARQIGPDRAGAFSLWNRRSDTAEPAVLRELELIRHFADSITERNYADQRLYLLQHIERIRSSLSASTAAPEADGWRDDNDPNLMAMERRMSALDAGEPDCDDETVWRRKP